MFVLPLLSLHVHKHTSPLKVRKMLARKESYICRQGSTYTFSHNGPTCVALVTFNVWDCIV